MDLIDRQAAIDALDKDPMGGLNYNRILNNLPSSQKTEKTDDLIKRQDAIDAICQQAKYANGDMAYLDAISNLPSAQRTGHWIDKTRNGQKNSECSECHTLFRVLIHDYPYCPICGSRNRGEEDGSD